MFISVASWKLGLFYYFCKLLSFVAIAFPSMFPGETSAASLRRLCKSSALACWANCFCYKFNIVNSWHNSNLVIVDWSRGKQVHLVFRVGLPKSRWFIILCYVKEDMLAHNDISGHFQFSILFLWDALLNIRWSAACGWGEGSCRVSGSQAGPPYSCSDLFHHCCSQEGVSAGCCTLP